MCSLVGGHCGKYCSLIYLEALIAEKMGCVASRIDNEERVQLFKERRRLMKQLVVFRGEFSDALLAYLRALRNTGVTLRQFTESESLEIEDGIINCPLQLPPSPPLPLPPSPPPPPNFSPDTISAKSKTRKDKAKAENEVNQEEEESIDIDEEDDCSGTPPPPIPSSSWDSWDPFETFADQTKSEQVVDQVEEENWVETRTQFEEVAANHLREEILEDANAADYPLPEKAELVDDSASMLSWNASGMVSWENKKSLEGIVKDLDDYFLRASALGREVAILIDINSGDAFTPQNPNENKRKRSNSAKVFGALSWSWSSKSLHLTRESSYTSGPSEPCRPGAHCITLAKLFAAEQLLHKEVKEEETAKLEHERKLSMLQRQEGEDNEWTKFEKTRLSVESLQSQITFLQESVGRTCSSILTLVDEELYPQLVTLTSGLMHMWKTMHECHQVQNHISLQLNHISVDQITDLNSDYHRHAAMQLESEVESWYDSFCLLIRSQRDYVRTLCRWIQLTDGLADEQKPSTCTSEVRKLCEQWLLHLEKVPHKVVEEAIKSLVLAVHSILMQQAEESDLQKKCEKLERRLEKESHSLDCLVGSSGDSTSSSSQLSPKHPVSVKRERIRGLKKLADDEKTKYLNSVQVTKAIVLNNLTRVLPNVFRALIGFSSSCIDSLDTIINIKIHDDRE